MCTPSKICPNEGTLLVNVVQGLAMISGKGLAHCGEPRSSSPTPPFCQSWWPMSWPEVWRNRYNLPLVDLATSKWPFIKPLWGKVPVLSNYLTSLLPRAICIRRGVFINRFRNAQNLLLSVHRNCWSFVCCSLMFRIKSIDYPVGSKDIV